MKTGEYFRTYLAGLPAAPKPDDRMWRDANGQPVGHIYKTRLTSAFQPIVRVADGGTIAWDALIRTYRGGDNALHPWNLFALAASELELIELDRLCRVLHTLAYFSRVEGGEALHVKVHERLLRGIDSHHGQTYRRILDRLGIGRHDVVIELPRAIVDNYRLMSQVTTNYRLNGFPVAVNFGQCDATALDSLLAECSFDILKAWAPAATRAGEQAAARLVEVARGRRLGLVFTRVENLDQLTMLRGAGANLVQGNLPGAPAPRPMRGSLAGAAEAAPA
jgi:EAL domain-containing protein (putative c-di-GMP-specific phosphodiesterase class I)